MRNGNISLKLAVTAVTKTMIILALFTAVLLFSGIQAFAEDPALEIQLDGKAVKEFSLNDLQKIAENEGDNMYSFSAWNTDPEFSFAEGVKGPTVDAVLTAAEVRDKVTGKCTVTFAGSSGSTVLTGEQLFETRYCYPHGGLVRFDEGVIPEEAYEDASETKAVISVGTGSGNALYVGQAAPSEQNAGLFINGVSSGGTINISTTSAPKCAQASSDLKEGTWRPGKTMELFAEEGADQADLKIYYGFSTKRSYVPDRGSTLYNYGSRSEQKCLPTISDENKPVYLCITVRAYGMQDSEVKRYIYKSGDALTVKADGITLKTYDPDEIAALQEEGVIDYSLCNSYPNISFRRISRYVRLDRLIEDAAGRSAESYGDDSVIRIASSDGYNTTQTIGQLFKTARYYFPNIEEGNDLEGGRIKEAGYEACIEVPAVLILDEDGEATFILGQADPGDQNNPECVKYMLSRGTVEISTQPAGKCSPVVKTDPPAGKIVKEGTAVRIALPETADMRDKMYYILDPADGEIPGPTCDLYNYAPYRYSVNQLPYFPPDLVNAPVLSGPGVHTMAVKVSSYGKKDSDLTKFRYFVSSAKTTGLKAAASYNSIKLTWNKESRIKGYKLYRKEGSGKEKLWKTISADKISFTDTGLKTGTAYSYRLALTALCPDGTEAEFTYSGTVSAKPVLSKPAIKKLTAGKKKITVKWSKVSGASGYEIYRSTSKTKGFSRVKTVASGATVSFVDKGLKKGKKYYYRIRAYRKISGGKVYSSYSPVLNAKSK